MHHAEAIHAMELERSAPNSGSNRRKGEAKFRSF
jgi:hypothetical protein